MRHAEMRNCDQGNSEVPKSCKLWKKSEKSVVSIIILVLTTYFTASISPQFKNNSYSYSQIKKKKQIFKNDLNC